MVKKELEVSKVTYCALTNLEGVIYLICKYQGKLVNMI